MSDEQSIHDTIREGLRRLIRDLADWLPGARLTLDRRRYNRARRKAVRAVLAGLARGGSR